MTIFELKNAVDEQVKKGNGSKTVFLSSDDEGNNFHKLLFPFTDIPEEIKTYLDAGMIDGDPDPNSIVFLG